MRLTLKVLRAPDGLLPEPRRVSEKETELSIGRGPDNSWVLPDPNRHLSKNHCVLAIRNGRWSVTDRSTNGTFVNRDIQPVGDGQSRNLRDGDRLRLGLYEIEVRIAEEETLHGRHNAWITQAGIDTPNADPFTNDPFNTTSRDPYVGDQSYVAPPLIGRPAGPNEPSAVDATLPQDSAVDPMLSRPPVNPGAGDDSLVARPETKVPLWDGATAHPLETVNFSRPRAEPTTEPVSVPAGDTGDALLGAFLRGAGMADTRPDNPAAVMESLGATFNALVTGLREVMITRARIKSEFRIEQTLMRSQGNNPLKFSADDQDALAALLGIGRRIDMKPAEAVSSALHDIHTHETAAIAGMKAGLAAVLARIEPSRVTGSTTPATLTPEEKIRAWDQYVRQHAELAASAPDDLEGIFGRAFARGYEQAINSLDKG